MDTECFNCRDTFTEGIHERDERLKSGPEVKPICRFCEQERANCAQFYCEDDFPPI